MKKIRLVVIASGVLLSAGAALAQVAPSDTKTPAPGVQGAAAAAPAPGMGMGMGKGMGMGMGRGPGAQAGADFTPGWALMTPQERTEHQKQMVSMKTYDECKTYVAQHHAQMVARATEKGLKPLTQPRRDACARLKP